MDIGTMREKNDISEKEIMRSICLNGEAPTTTDVSFERLDCGTEEEYGEVHPENVTVSPGSLREDRATGSGIPSFRGLLITVPAYTFED